MSSINQQSLVHERRTRRQLRVRKKLFGTTERPRLAVFRSSKHIYAQVINDETGSTLVLAGTLDPAIKSEIKSGGNKEAATAVGRLIADRAKKAGIDKICFDRRSYKYHGRVAALADAVREGWPGFLIIPTATGPADLHCLQLIGRPRGPRIHRLAD